MMAEERETLDCCKECSYQCKQFDDLTTLSGCIIADVEVFGTMNKPLKISENPKEIEGADDESKI